MEPQEIKISDDYITLSQLLKLTNIFESGGFIKSYVNEEGVFVNEEPEFRRGRKLYPEDIVKLKTGEVFIVKTE